MLNDGARRGKDYYIGRSVHTWWAMIHTLWTARGSSGIRWLATRYHATQAKKKGKRPIDSMIQLPFCNQ